MPTYILLVTIIYTRSKGNFNVQNRTKYILVSLIYFKRLNVVLLLFCVYYYCYIKNKALGRTIFAGDDHRFPRFAASLLRIPLHWHEYRLKLRV